MSIFGDGARWLLIGGWNYPRTVEAVMSGEMQARFAHPLPNTRTHKKLGHTVIHPNYCVNAQFETPRQTLDAIRGAIALRLIGVDGVGVDELQEVDGSSDEVAGLEFLGGQPVKYNQLGVLAGVNFLKITRIVQVRDSVAVPRDRGATMLESNPDQPYTILPAELRQFRSVDIGGGEYPWPVRSIEQAQAAYAQYSPYYQSVREIE